jgi:hypothetical protein
MWYYRKPGESDDCYYMRVFRTAQRLWPWMDKVDLYFGSCDVTGLPCLHPVNVRTHISGRPPLEYLEDQPPSRRVDSEWLRRFNQDTFCPVCQTAAPTEPVFLDRNPPLAGVNTDTEITCKMGMSCADCAKLREARKTA